MVENIETKRKGVKKIMKKLIGMLLVLILTVGVASSVWAYPLPVNFKMKLIDWEFFNPAIAPGAGPFGDKIEDNWGIANISDIYDLDGDPSEPVWQVGDNGERLRVMFWGLDVTSWSGADGTFTTGAATSTVGGAAIPYAGADLWLWDSDLAGYLPLSALIGNRTGYSAFTSVSGSNAGLQASFAFAPGIAGLGVLTKGGTSLIANPPVGHGAGYLDVLPGGAVGSLLDTDGFPTAFGNRDAFFEFNFRIPGSGGFQLNSDDPFLGHAVPEPTTMLLFGMGALGLVTRLRRKRVA